MNKPPVNSIDLPVISQIHTAITQLEADPKVKGLILTSALKNVFSAGIDFTNFYKPKETNLRNFWSEFKDCFGALYGSRLNTFCAINGTSPAGGCVLSMACDYRVMVNGKGKIGMNETELGLYIPKWVTKVFSGIVGQRKSELILQKGTLMSPEEAHRIGLVDELVKDEEELMVSADKHFNTLFQVDQVARHMTKMAFREEVLKELKEGNEEELKSVWNFVTRVETQERFERIIKQLQEAKLKKAGN